MVDAFSNQKPEFQQLKKVLDALLVGVGVLFLGYTIVQFYAQWTQLDRQALLLKLALPAWLTIGVLPFIYVLSLYVVYEGALRGVNWATSDWRARWRTRFVLVRDFRLRRNELRSFTWMWIKRAAVAPDVTGARAVVQQFSNEQRAAEQAERDAEERLWRYAGSNKTDTEGRRLDRREFKETTEALRYLASCQMGWYRNRGGGGATTVRTCSVPSATLSLGAVYRRITALSSELRKTAKPGTRGDAQSLAGALPLAQPDHRLTSGSSTALKNQTGFPARRLSGVAHRFWTRSIEIGADSRDCRAGLGLAQRVRHLFLGEFRTLHRSHPFCPGAPQSTTVLQF